jgi:hypothetical protein
MVWNRFVTIFWNKSMGKVVVCNLARAKLEKILVLLWIRLCLLVAVYFENETLLRK